jgi:lysozyme family protein
MEGGWTDDPVDPGGPTNFGITLADYARDKDVTLAADTFGALKAELKAIPQSTVRRIYRERYWQPACCPQLSPALAFFHFDAAVNQGVTGAARMLQEAVGATIDGEIGPETLAKTGAQSVATTLDRYADIRRRHYRSLSTFWRFGKGWLARVDRTLAAARALSPGNERRPDSPPHRAEGASSTRRGEGLGVGGTPNADVQQLPAPSQPKETTTMTDQTQPAATPANGNGNGSKWWGSSMTIWGAAITTLSTVLPVVGPLIGLNVTAELVQQLGDQIVIVVQAVGGLVGTILTIYGRARATTTLERRQMTLTM